MSFSKNLYAGPKSFTLIASVLFLLVTAMIPLSSKAQDLALPQNKVILTIDGNIKNHNVGTQADFDMAMLQSLPVTRFRTLTPWTNNVIEFEGVSMADILHFVGAEGKTIHALALNDYAIDIPIENIVNFGAIIAYKADGKEMPIREKGPLWILFPFDDREEIKSEASYSWSVWQLKKLTVLE